MPEIVDEFARLAVEAEAVRFERIAEVMRRRAARVTGYPSDRKRRRASWLREARFFMGAAQRMRTVGMEAVARRHRTTYTDRD